MGFSKKDGSGVELEFDNDEDTFSVVSMDIVYDYPKLKLVYVNTKNMSRDYMITAWYRRDIFDSPGIELTENKPFGNRCWMKLYPFDTRKWEIEMMGMETNLIKILFKKSK